MYKMQKEGNQAVILAAFQSYLTGFDKKYNSPLHTVSRQECDRANYIQSLINTMVGRHGSAPRQPDRKMMSVTLECLMRYRRVLSDEKHQQFRFGNSGQQQTMYSDRLSRQRLDNTFWALSKPYLASLSDTQTMQMKRLSGHFSPMETIQIVISHEDELGDSHTEEHILEDANEMNSGHYDTYLPQHRSVRKMFKGLFGHLKKRRKKNAYAKRL